MIIAALITCAIVITWIILFKKCKNSKLFKSMLSAVCIIFLCEIFIFNAGVFRTAFSRLPHYQLTFSNAKMTNLVNTDNKLYALNAGGCSVEFQNIGCPVETIHFDISSSKNFVDKKISVSFSDATRVSMRNNFSRIDYIANNEQTEYIACSFSGNVQKIKFSFKLEAGEQIVIDSIGINEDIPLNISPIRLVFLMLLILPIVAVLNCKKRDEAVDMLFFKRVCIVTAAFFAVVPIILCFYQSGSAAVNLKNPSLWECGILCSIGIIFLAMTYFSFVKSYFPNISNAIAILGLFTAEIASGIWYSTVAGNSNELAQSIGFASITAGSFFLLGSNAVGMGKVSLLNACISSILLAFAALCKPTLAIYCVVALLFIFFGVGKLQDKKQALIKYLGLSLIPFAGLGVAKLLGFGSLLDSQAANLSTQTQFHWSFVSASLYNYLFAVPVFQTGAPYILDNFNSVGVNGYYYAADTTAIGLFFKALPMFGYVLAGKAWKYSGKNKKVAILTLAACVVAPFLMIFSTWKSGYSTIYASDFCWQLLFGAYIILFTIYTASTSLTTKKLLTSFFAVSAIIAFLIVVAQMCAYIDSNVDQELRVTIVSLVRLFDFFNIF